MPTETTPSITAHVKQNIVSIAQLEQHFHRPRSPADRLSAAVSRFVGSVRFIAAHAVLFGLWVVVNLLLPAKWRFDHSFTFLQVWAGVEALFLAAFVLMAQNRQGRLVEHWTHVTLQVGLLTEQEMTKMLQLQQMLCDYMGLRQAAADPQLQQMVKPTDVEALVAEVGKAREVDDELVARVEELVEAKERRVEAATGEEGPRAAGG